MTSLNSLTVTLEELEVVLNNDYSESSCFVLVDENTRKLCLPHLIQKCPSLQKVRIIEIFSGEQHKNLETFVKIIEQLTENNADRKSLLINLGGGVICDMGGFVAACYKRGIDFINIPTTLLAMVDAAHGGKTGIDFNNFKNQIGVFTPAKKVVIDVDFLKTLPKREVLSGFSEMIKMSLITSTDFWNKIETVNLENLQSLEPLIFQAIDEKKNIVENDPTEQNIRKFLNFGHTFGHAFETFALANGKNLSHGHAVAIGILCELWLSEKILNFDVNLKQKISNYILSIYSKFPIQKTDFEHLIQILLKDKKNINAQIMPVLLKKIGEPQYDLTCSKELCLEALQMYLDL